MHVGMQTFCQLEIKKKYKKSCANYTIFFSLQEMRHTMTLCVYGEHIDPSTTLRA